LQQPTLHLLGDGVRCRPVLGLGHRHVEVLDRIDAVAAEAKEELGQEGLALVQPLL